MSQTSLLILFLNCENLFSPGENFYGSAYTQAEYDAKIDWMANFIIDKQAHIVGLTEVGSDAELCITDLVNRIGQITGENKFAHHFIAVPNIGSAKIRNAVISEFPINQNQSTSLEVFPDNFAVNLLTPGTSSSNPNCSALP